MYAAHLYVLRIICRLEHSGQVYSQRKVGWSGDYAFGAALDHPVVMVGCAGLLHIWLGNTARNFIESFLAFVTFCDSNLHRYMSTDVNTAVK